MLKRMIIATVLLCLIAIGFITARFFWPALPQVNYKEKFLDLWAMGQPSGAGVANVEPEIRRLAQRLADWTNERDAQLQRARDTAGSEAAPIAIDWGVVWSRSREETAQEQCEVTMRAVAELREEGFFRETAVFDPAARSVALTVQEGDWFSANLDEMKLARTLMLCLRARLESAILADNPAEAAAAFRESLGLSIAIARRPTIVDNLIGVAGVGGALHSIRELTVDSGRSPELLRALLRVLQSTDTSLDLARAVDGERLWVLSVIQDHYQRRRASMILSVSMPSMIRFTHAEAVAGCNQIFDGYRALAASKSVPSPSEISRAVDMADRIADDHVLLGLLAPAISSVVNMRHALDCARDGTSLCLAIELYRAMHSNRPPDSLDDLVPGILPALPIDRFAPDGKFRYRRAGNDSNAARAYLIYSVGLDGADNDGKAYSKAPWSSLTSEEAVGTDFILNEPDRSGSP